MLLRVVLLLLLMTATAFSAKDSYRRIPQTSFGTGERFEYRVHYGIFNAANAVVEVSPQIQYVNGRPCYKINIVGTTLGAFSWFAKVRDEWQSWMDTSAIVSQKFYRNIQENNYRKVETTVFNHDTDDAVVTDENGTKKFDVPNHIQDAISGYFYLRTLDFTKLSPNEVVDVPTFFESSVYKLKIKYKGKDTVKTKFGKIKAFKLAPIMPNNELFKGENSIRIWVSDDANKVPIKVEVDLWVGSLVMEVSSYGGARNSFKWY
ncbi:MAG: DUF3108 domain-containing protein [Spirosomataceae bacterium]